MKKRRKARLMLAASMIIAVAMILWPVSKGAELETAIVGWGELVESTFLIGKVRYAQEQPLISLKSGTVRHVYIQPGQEVQKDELLFKLDTAAEEQALAALHSMKYDQKAALPQADLASVLVLQNNWELRTLETQLLASIAASCIRSSFSGVVEEVYVQEGDYAQEATVMGIMRGSDKRIVATAALAQTIPAGSTGYAKIGEHIVPVRLAEILPPAGQDGVRVLSFEAVSYAEWDSICEGENAEIEVITTVHPASALVPLAAIDSEGNVWVAENGKVYAEKLEWGPCGDTVTGAGAEWTGKQVILYPDSYELKDGMAVRVKK